MRWSANLRCNRLGAKWCCYDGELVERLTTGCKLLCISIFFNKYFKVFYWLPNLKFFNCFRSLYSEGRHWILIFVFVSNLCLYDYFNIISDAKKSIDPTILRHLSQSCNETIINNLKLARVSTLFWYSLDWLRQLYLGISLLAYGSQS